MKESYESPEIEILVFETEDIITASIPIIGSDDEGGWEW